MSAQASKPVPNFIERNKLRAASRNTKNAQEKLLPTPGMRPAHTSRKKVPETSRQKT